MLSVNKPKRKQLQGDPLMRGPHIFVYFTSRSSPGPHNIYIKRKIPFFQQGEGERDHFEMHQIILFFLTRPTL